MYKFKDTAESVINEIEASLDAASVDRDDGYYLNAYTFALKARAKARLLTTNGDEERDVIEGLIEEANSILREAHAYLSCEVNR